MHYIITKNYRPSGWLEADNEQKALKRFQELTPDAAGKLIAEPSKLGGEWVQDDVRVTKLVQLLDLQYDKMVFENRLLFECPILKTIHLDVLDASYLMDSVRFFSKDGAVEFTARGLVWIYPEGVILDISRMLETMAPRASKLSYNFWTLALALRVRGYSHVKFDADGPLIPGLPTFFW